MADKGYAQTSETPDFLLVSHGGHQTRIVVSNLGYGYGHGRWSYRHGGYGDYDGAQVHQYQEGTLILDVVLASTKELIWRGTARGVIDPDPTPEQRTELVNNAVRQVLQNFPPPPDQ